MQCLEKIKPKSEQNYTLFKKSTQNDNYYALFDEIYAKNDKKTMQ